MRCNKRYIHTRLYTLFFFFPRQVLVSNRNAVCVQYRQAPYLNLPKLAKKQIKKISFPII